MIAAITTRRLLIISFALILSCEQKNNQGRIEIVDRDGTEYKVEYHENGEVKSEQPLFHGKPYGFENIYDEDGLLIQGRTWKDGKVYSHQFEYFYEKDTFLATDGEDTFRTLGNKIHKYAYIDENGKAPFNMEYDKTGGVEFYQGKSTVEYFMNKESHNKGDTLELTFVYPLLYYFEGFESALLVKVDSSWMLVDNLNVDLDILRSKYKLILTGENRLNLAVANSWYFDNMILRDTSFIKTISPQPSASL